MQRLARPAPAAIIDIEAHIVEAEQKAKPKSAANGRSRSLEIMNAQNKVDRLCPSRFADLVAAGKILKSDAELLEFAALPKEQIGQAALWGVIDSKSLKEFKRKVAAGEPTPGEWERKRRASGQWQQEGGAKP
jgi:hypothetical protein